MVVILRFCVDSPCKNISLYEPEQSLSLSQDEGEQC